MESRLAIEIDFKRLNINGLFLVLLEVTLLTFKRSRAIKISRFTI